MSLGTVPGPPRRLGVWVLIDLWLIDLATGTERQLTRFAPDFDVRDFDISPDGREIVLEQVQQQSDVVLIELPRQSPGGAP